MLRVVSILFFVQHINCFLDFSYSYNVLKIDLSSRATSDALSKVQTRWIQQPLDHFNRTATDSWSMRYFENLDLWRPGGPIYIFIGGEGEANPVFLTGGLIYELANETNGALYATEHRFYGKSIPIGGKGTKRLKYLSSQQALADLAHFIKVIKLLPSFIDTKVVVVGGSYPGNLAAWMKLYYPNVVDAALSSSAPVLAKVDFFEYLETVSDVYEQHGGFKCYNFIKNKFQSYSYNLKSADGIRKLKEEEKICNETDMTIVENQDYFISSKAGSFMWRTQYGTVDSIKKHCNILLKSKENRIIDDFEYNKYFESHKALIKKSDKNCYDYNYTKSINEIKNNSDWLQSWLYQVCSEFSYAQTTSSEKQIFTNLMKIETFYKTCFDVFGEGYGEEKVKQSVRKTNEFYQGLNPSVSNVIFVNGDMDPWHRLAILEDVSYQAPAIFIPNSSHCRDLYSTRPNDTEELKEARAEIKYWIKTWLGYEINDRKIESTCMH